MTNNAKKTSAQDLVADAADKKLITVVPEQVEKKTEAAQDGEKTPVTGDEKQAEPKKTLKLRALELKAKATEHRSALIVAGTAVGFLALAIVRKVREQAATDKLDEMIIVDGDDAEPRPLTEDEKTEIRHDIEASVLGG